MHYLNGKEANVGDVVVCPTHGSRGQLRIGIVLETMPNQGNCSMKLKVICRGSSNPDDPCQIMGGNSMVETIYANKKEQFHWDVGVEYADVKEAVLVQDAFRAVSGMHKYCTHDAPYFRVPGVGF